MRRYVILSLMILGLAVLIPSSRAGDRSVVDASQGNVSNSISGTVVDELPSGRPDFRLALLQPKPFDGATVSADRRFVAGSKLRIAPTGWTCAPSGGSWICGGPAIEPDNPARFAWTVGPGVRIPESFGVQLSYQGRRVAKDRIHPSTQHGIEVKTDLEGLLDLPSGVLPGALFMVGLVSDELPGPGWRLRLGEEIYAPVDPEGLDWGSGEWNLHRGELRDRLFFRLPLDFTLGSRLGFSFLYDNSWGDRVVDARPPDWFFGDPTGRPCSPAGLQACQERVLVGSSVCVCGCFPSPFVPDLTLDGKPIPFPMALSSRVIRIPLQDVEPGTHRIAWGSVEQSVEFEAVSLSGAIGQEKLQLGQSTGLDFRLDGSRALLPLKIDLESGGVQVQGGNHQIAYFNGSDPNTIRRRVLATGLGDFSIAYTLGLPPCPCGGWEGVELEDPAYVTHPMFGRGWVNTSLGGEGLGMRLDLASDAIIARSPRPPFDPSQPLTFSFAQLGLRASTPGFGDLTFEQRANEPSTATVTNLRLGDGGGLASGEARLDLHTQFSMKYQKDLPLRIGQTYDFDVSDFEIGGSVPGLGSVSFQKIPASPSSIRFSNLDKDRAGTTLFGDADFKLTGRLRIGE